MTGDSTFRYSRHAMCRLAQRGISTQAMRVLLNHGDSFHAGRGCSYVQLSRSALRLLAADATLTCNLRSLATLQAIVSDDGEVVTCYHASAKRLGSSRRRPSYKYH